MWLLFDVGCRTLSTTDVTPESGPVNGALFYYLPIGKITLTGQAPLPPSPTPTATVTATPTATPSPAVQIFKPRDEAPPSDDGGNKPAAPNTFAGGQVSVTLTAEVEADDDAGVYYVSPQANYLFEDEVQISAKKHLLNTGKVTTEDKTVEIIGTVASIAANIPKTAYVLPGETPKPQPFTFSFHPHNASEVRNVSCQLQRRGITMKVTAEGVDVTAPCSPVHKISDTEKARLKNLAQLTTKAGNPTKGGSPGLLFRPGVSYKISLSYSEPGSRLKAISASQQFILPDPTRLYVMRYDRMAFVKKVREVGFTDGMLTDFHQKVPSPILGFLGIPKAIVQAIAPIPGAAPTGSGSATGTSGSQ